MNPKTTIDRTDAKAYVEEAMRGRLDDLRVLSSTADGHGCDYANEELEAVGVEFDSLDTAEDAGERLFEYPLCIDVTTTFEIILGIGGPDDRLLVECDVDLLDPSEFGRFPDAGGFTIRRVLYRYSWYGSAEVVLSGEDRETAESLARRVVPELA